MKCEQRRHGRFECVAERNSQLPQRGRAAAANGEQQFVAISPKFLLAVGKDCQFKSAAGSFLDARFQTPRNSSFNFIHAGLVRRVEQAINDGLRRISRGKHPAIVFGFEFHAALLEPRDGVAGLKFFERRDQRAFAARITRCEFTRIETGVRDIAAPAAGNFHLGKKLRSLFENDNFRVAIAIRRRPARQKSPPRRRRRSRCVLDSSA